MLSRPLPTPACNHRRLAYILPNSRSLNFQQQNKEKAKPPWSGKAREGRGAKRSRRETSMTIMGSCGKMQMNAPRERSQCSLRVNGTHAASARKRRGGKMQPELTRDSCSVGMGCFSLATRCRTDLTRAVLSLAAPGRISLAEELVV
ncbi:hypothetical protein ZHAS_00005355 [Anopheles sinensis]|uniref:Uncharacterized protein n=1 Tax=Anopheles sinensis TaxID=74873 RepID=A0A084VJD8_ANOSI|nr:hypothetical protein ZHAS_00005355 [Anopheles sinensis]